MGRRKKKREQSTMIFPLTFSALLLLLVATPSLGQNSATGDFTTTSNKRLFNCCNRAAQICRNPCSGRECTAKCTVRCGFLGGRVCHPVTCEVANPTGCTAMGATLASVESQAEHDAVYALTGSTGAWIGLADWLDEGNFNWINGATFDAATSYTNWMNNQPNNNNNNQHCVWIRPDGRWT